MQNKALSLLGIAKKAGRLAVGSEATAISTRQGKAWLVITAADASKGTVRRAKANATAASVDYVPVPFTKFEIGSITGRGSPGVAAILDKGLAAGFKERLEEKPEEKAEDINEKKSENKKLNKNNISTHKAKRTQNKQENRQENRKESDAQ